MIEFYKTTDEGTVQIENLEPGCWVNVMRPSSEERTWLLNDLEIAPEFIRSALDDEESPHTDFDDDTRQVLVILDCASIEDRAETVDDTIVQYDTQPLAFLMVPEKECIVTLSLVPNETVRLFTTKRLHKLDTENRTDMMLQMMLYVSQQYLVCLRNIHRQFIKNEKELHRTMRNKELIKMLGFEKSLVYFSTSLKADDAVLQKLNTGRVVKLDSDDRDVLEDVTIEIRQAMEMSSIYATILNGSMETFGTVISNNLNLTMRTLTAMALVLAIPTIIFSFYGMNVAILPLDQTWIWPVLMAVGVSVVSAVVLWARKFFIK